MGSFMASPQQMTASQPPSATGQQSQMDSLLGGQNGMMQSPQQAEVQAQAGALEQLRQMELAIGSLSQMAQQMSAVYPGGAEPARIVMQSLEQARQGLLGMLVPMMSTIPDAQSNGPAFMGG